MAVELINIWALLTISSRRNQFLMNNSKSVEDMCEIVAGTMRDFREGMDRSHQLSIRIGRRTTQIIRFGTISVLALALAMFYLVYILAQDFARVTTSMDFMAERMASMETHFADVSARLAHMDGTLSSMNQSVFVLPQINQTLDVIGTSTWQMSGDIRGMLGNLEGMRGDVSSMSGNLDTMDQNVGGLNNSVQHMTGSVQRMDYGVHKMSRPMDFFPLK